jgi:hypothetical protein
MTTLRRSPSKGKPPQTIFAASVVPDVKTISLGDSAFRNRAAARRDS